MFLLYGSYEKQTRYKEPDASKAQIYQNQNGDEFTFSDFLIRKHPKKNVIQLFKHPQDEGSKTNKQRQMDSQNDHECMMREKRRKEMTIFCLPNKKVFQMNFLQEKNKKDETLQPSFKKQSGQKFKKQIQLIHQRKNRKNVSYTPKPSARKSSGGFRYSEEIGQEQKSYSSFQNQSRKQRRSIEICINYTQSPNLLQTNEMSLTNAYKVKSLVLVKNPKEQLSSKSKKLIAGIFENRYNKKILSPRTRSEKPLHKKMNSTFVQTSRMSTENRNDNHLNTGRLQSGVKQSYRKSVKLNSIFDRIGQDLQSQQAGLEPWSKENEIDLFHETVPQACLIQEGLLELKEQSQKDIGFDTAELGNLESKPLARKNCFRKIYSTKQNSKMKSTILSQK